ncbi:MAG: glycosyltransferase [Pyrinomonadaceae bacterium]
MDNELKNRIPESVKKPAIKFIVFILRNTLWAFRNLYNFSYKVVRFAGRQGLDFERELPPAIANLLKISQTAAGINSFSVDDYLLLNASPQTPETIETSIIIPVFNKAEFTFQCLRSIFQEVDLTKNEIIIVDNASSDTTRQMLDHLGGRVRVIRNITNKGFVEACNQGAAAAAGKFLVFLNNDTIVKSNWLKALIETVKADETVGAVGSMLIYPHGHLQEAGGIVWRDASAFAYGWGENPQDGRFNFVREVDYCSGASLFIKKSLFDKLGGFDMRFAPAYYEDTDLCMSVRAAGFKVIYQPASQVIHIEGATAGTSTQGGFKRFQEINRYKFAEKWREILDREHHLPLKANIPEASNRNKGRRIIVFFNQVPKPDKDSGSVRLFAILRMLGKFNRVVLVHVKRKESDAIYERRVENLGIEIVWIVDFEERFKRENCDVAILCYPKVGNLMYSIVRKKFPDAKIIYDTVDVHFVRLQREFGLTGDKQIAQDALKYRKIESRLAKNADQVWCVTEEDKRFLLEAAPGTNIAVIPNIHDLHGRGKTFADRRDLLFIGSFDHRPNEDAIEYFLNEIFPLILEKLPDVRFHIVGSNPPPEIFAKNSENVLVEGYVADITPLFESCRVFVAPLRYGAGMKGKIGQALSYGLPPVTTSIGAEGMNLVTDTEVLIADNPADFAAAVVRVYESEEIWNKLSDNGYRFIGQNFSPGVISEKVAALIGVVIDKRTKYLKEPSA